MDDADRSKRDEIGGRRRIKVHIAGVLGDDLVQRCVRCGSILSDYRNSCTTGDGIVSGFAVGVLVAMVKGSQWVTGPTLEANEVKCDLFERN